MGKDSIKDRFVEAVASALPENPIVTKWIETGAITELVNNLVDILIDELEE